MNPIYKLEIPVYGLIEKQIKYIDLDKLISIKGPIFMPQLYGGKPYFKMDLWFQLMEKPIEIVLSYSKLGLMNGIESDMVPDNKEAEDLAKKKVQKLVEDWEHFRKNENH